MLSERSNPLDSYRQMEALLHAARELNSAHDLPSALQIILRSMNDVMPFAFAAVLLPDFSTGTLDIMGSIRPQDVSVALPAGPTLKIPFGQGLSGHVFSNGEPMVVHDVRLFPGYLDSGVDGVLSEMAVPLKRGGTIVGVLNVGRDGVDAFASDDLDMLSLFASQAAIAIENARLFSEQRRRVEELLAIQSIIEKITPYHDPPTIAGLISSELKALIDYYECRIFLLDMHANLLFSLDESVDPVPRLKPGEGFAGWIALHERSDIISDVRQDARVYFTEEQLPAASMVGAPMIYGDRVRGAITLSKHGVNQFDENARRLLEIIAGQAAIAFDRARLYEELRTEAITDPVVKLHNRRYIMERFREERARTIRTGTPLACLMLDVDGFKRVNDTYGHDAGDTVLRELAGLIRRQIRTEDVAARYGGEEFCILLPGSFQEQAAYVGERVRRAIANHRMPPEAGIDYISVSMGLAILDSSDKNTEVFTRADAAMYAAKAAGGNRLVAS